jgi:hypothetical protein
MKELQDELTQLRDDAATLNKRTDEALRNLKKTTSGIHRRFDAVEILQRQAIDTARALKEVLLRIHSDEFSMDDYYSAVRELMRGALTSMSNQFDPNDPRFESFKRDVRTMFTEWQRIVPVALSADSSMTDLMEVIGAKKSAMATARP